MKVLNIISSGYRATLEEQDDTVVWLTHAIKGAGAEVDVLLRGPAANYAVDGQEAAPLTFGARTQRHAPDVYGQVAALSEKGVNVFVVEEDLRERGLAAAPRLRAAQVVPKAQVAALLSKYERCWHW
ncbi:MAG TPA: DsrE family protein [Vitreimonas sp.]|jgi:intracellular sulfur oxidation DsrE/DsrF family protein|nr:DsrE family protein [Vitreimonas sp.]